jgi:hypothetical protein
MHKALTPWFPVSGAAFKIEIMIFSDFMFGLKAAISLNHGPVFFQAG